MTTTTPQVEAQFIHTFVTVHHKFAALCRSFPTIARHVPAEAPITSDEWWEAFWERMTAFYPKASKGERLALAFLSGVWTGGANLVGGPKFDLFEAMAHFDSKHQSAMLSWINDPFWP